eukprot:COSAG02_NODE_9301_length_2262_cov_1.304207_2_plen_172_part_00
MENGRSKKIVVRHEPCYMIVPSSRFVPCEELIQPAHYLKCTHSPKRHLSHFVRSLLASCAAIAPPCENPFYRQQHAEGGWSSPLRLLSCSLPRRSCVGSRTCKQLCALTRAARRCVPSQRNPSPPAPTKSARRCSSSPVLRPRQRRPRRRCPSRLIRCSWRPRYSTSRGGS